MTPEDRGYELVARDSWHSTWMDPATGHAVFIDRDELDDTWSVHTQVGEYDSRQVAAGLSRPDAAARAAEEARGTDITGGL